MTSPAVPTALKRFLLAKLPLFQQSPPDSEWVRGLAIIHGTTPEVVWEAVRAQMPTAPATPPPPVWIHPLDNPVGAPVMAPVPAPDPPTAALDTQHDRILSALRARGCRILPKRDSEGRDAVRAQCPAHSDAKPSLVITREHDTVLLTCFGRCRTSQVVGALGLKLKDLFANRRHRTPHRIVATYDYHTLDGRLVGRKIRYEPKRFRWQMHSVEVGPYRLPDLIESSMVVLTEGEKAADRLSDAGFAATCGPVGGSRWTSDWSRSLWMAGCRALVIVPDNDEPGRAFAEQVAITTQALDVDEPIQVKVLTLPGLAPKADVVDWLDAGHDADELMALARATPTWSPALAADERQRERKERRAQRNKRYRDKLRGADIRASHAVSADRRGRTPGARSVPAVPADIRASHEPAPDIRASPVDRPDETLRRETPANVPLGASQKELSRNLLESREVPLSVSVYPEDSSEERR